jgi:hypothetical protein
MAGRPPGAELLGKVLYQGFSGERIGDATGVELNVTGLVKEGMLLDTGSCASRRGNGLIADLIKGNNHYRATVTTASLEKLQRPCLESRPEPEILPVKLSTAMVSVPPGSFAVVARFVLEDVLSLECRKTDWTAV